LKVIINKDENNTRFVPGRKYKRDLAKKLTKSSHQKVTKQDVENYILLQRLKSGNITDDEIKDMTQGKVDHYDNVDLFPDGTEAKLNYDAIIGRKDQLTEKFVEWVEAHKEDTFHLIRDGSMAGLVSLEEDQRFYEDEKTKEIKQEPRWLFDLFADLFVKNENGEFVDPWTVEGAEADFVDLKDGLNGTPEESEVKEDD